MVIHGHHKSVKTHMRSQSLYSILFVYKTNMVSVALQDMERPVFVQVILLFAGIKYVAFSKQAVKALARLCVCANSSEPSL